MSNLSTPPRWWLRELFLFENCAECGGDERHHTAVPVFGNWLARCDYPPHDSGQHPEPIFPHPVVAADLAADGEPVNRLG